MAIMEEHVAFEAMRDALVADPATAGKHVLIFGGKLEGAFGGPSDAYAAGLRRFGTDAEFLITRAERKGPPVVILAAWELGLVRVEQA